MDRRQVLEQLKEGLIFKDIEYRAHTILETQGSCNNLIFFVENGWVKLSRCTDQGNENIVDICGPKEFIGIPTLFLDCDFPFSVIAITAGRVSAVKKDLLEHFLLQHPEIMATFFVELNKIIYKLRAIRVIANRQVADDQVLSLLVHLANLFGTDNAGGRLIPFNINQQDIADLVGLSRTSVNISLKSLLKQGYLQRKGTFYVIATSR